RYTEIKFLSRQTLGNLPVSVSSVVFAILVGGCSSVIQNSFTTDETTAKSVSLDARQHVVLKTDKGKKHGQKTHHLQVVYTEPSPDMFSNVIASLGANACFEEKTAE
ncbi:MAG: hypothetical protein PVI92_14240, partial [Chromatiales bacterium]